MTTNTMQLKLINKEIIKSALLKMDSGTKGTLAQDTGLSVATCGNLLDELMMTGEVKETSQGPSTGGRPSRQFIYNDNFAYICAVYVRVEGNEKTIFSSVANLAGTVVHESELHREDITAETLSSIISEKIKMFPKIKSACIGIPGVVSNGMIDICDIRELEGINLRQILAEKLSISVVIENDVNSSAVGFLGPNCQKEPESLAYIYYPENGNPGCGIIINGKIIYGSSAFAGEVSYLPLGVPPEEQGSAQNDRDKFPKLVAGTLASLNCIINPAKIIIAGRVFDDELNNSIIGILKMLNPANHLPVILFITDVHESLINGLITIALENQNNGLRLVRKNLQGED